VTKGGFTRHAAFYLAAAAVTAAAPFLITPFLTRWLGPDGFGTMGAFLALVNVGGVFVGLSTHGRISVSYFRDGESAMRGYVGAALAVLMMTGFPLLVGLHLKGGELAVATGVPEQWLWTAWICACGQFVVFITLAVWQVRQQVWHYAVTQVGYTVLWVLLSMAFIGWAGMGWEGRALGQTLTAIIGILLCLVVLTKGKNLEWNVRSWPIGSALKFGFPLLPHSLAAIAMATADRFTLSATLGEQATGEYFAAYQIAFVITAAATATNQAWMPWLFARLARADYTSKKEVARLTYIIYGVLLGAAVVMVLLRGPLVHVVAGADFVASVVLLGYLAPAAAFNGMYFFAANYLFYAGRTGLLSAITVTAAIVQVGLMLWLVDKGAKGVASAALIASVLYWLMTAIAAARVSPLRSLRLRSVAAVRSDSAVHSS
jgi:O-antigen/teichoic acid export membrane protein